jgi:hypothetical protein
MESSAAPIATSGPRAPNARAFLAGGGATAALVAGAVVAFLAVAAFVAFNGIPSGSDNSSGARVSVTPTAAASAAAAASPAANAVAASPAAPTAAAASELLAAQPPSSTATTGLEQGGNSPVPASPTLQDPTVIFPPGTDAGGNGPVGGVVDGIDDTTAGLGLDLGLGDTTDQATQQLDDTVRGTLNSVGGTLGNPNLGDQTSDTITEITSGLIGKGSLTDRLLSP